MFKNIADDLFDQLNYIADQGFTAFEDNNLKKELLKLKIKWQKLKKRNSNGCLVAHTIHWKDPNLASGDKSKDRNF